MRYVQGQRPRERCCSARARSPPERALAILGQVAGALDAAHRARVSSTATSSRRTCCSTRTGTRTSTDFGVTQAARRATPTRRRRGSPGRSTTSRRSRSAASRSTGAPTAIRSPACSTSASRACRRSAARPPAETLWAHLREEPPPLESHPALDPVLRRGLAQEPGERYPTCAALIDAARDVTEPAAPGARASSPRAPGRRARPPRRRARRRAARGAIRAGRRGRRRPRPRPGTASRRHRAGVGAHSRAFVESAAAPSNIAVGEGAVWFLNSADDTVARIDPETKAITRRIHSSGRVDRPTPRARGRCGSAPAAANGGNWTDTVYRGSIPGRRRSRNRGAAARRGHRRRSSLRQRRLPADRGRRRRGVGDRRRRRRAHRPRHRPARRDGRR